MVYYFSRTKIYGVSFKVIANTKNQIAQWLQHCPNKEFKSSKKAICILRWVHIAAMFKVINTDLLF